MINTTQRTQVKIENLIKTGRSTGAAKFLRDSLVDSHVGCHTVGDSFWRSDLHTVESALLVRTVSGLIERLCIDGFKVCNRFVGCHLHEYRHLIEGIETVLSSGCRSNVILGLIRCEHIEVFRFTFFTCRVKCGMLELTIHRVTILVLERCIMSLGERILGHDTTH